MVSKPCLAQTQPGLAEQKTTAQLTRTILVRISACANGQRTLQNKKSSNGSSTDRETGSTVDGITNQKAGTFYVNELNPRAGKVGTHDDALSIQPNQTIRRLRLRQSDVGQRNSVCAAEVGSVNKTTSGRK